MDAGKKVKLQSGAILVVNQVDFSLANKLYKHVAETFVHIQGDPSVGGMLGLLKGSAGLLVSNPKVEEATWECMKRCTYNGEKITPETFEPKECRGDYVKVFVEVLMETTLPFMSSLYVEFGEYLSRMMEEVQK